MEAIAIERQLDLGRRYLDRGQHHAAIETFRRVLTLDPDSAEAHALLALALHASRRLHAAELEAGRAMLGDPESPLSHLAMAWVQYSARRWKLAREHTESALAFAPDDGGVSLACARLAYAMADVGRARTLAERALELEPDSVQARVLLGSIALLHERNLDEARARAFDALAIEPDDPEAVVLRGWVALYEGEVEEAREQAVFALSMAPNDENALRLLVAVKARTSWFLGLWWRMNAWIATGDDSRQSLLLLSMFALQGFAKFGFRDVGMPTAASFVALAWTASCIYSWIGPAWFRRSVEKEMREVRLRDDF